LTNPAGANVQLLGVYDGDLVLTLAEVLRDLGSRRAMVVHGAGGLDELSLAGSNRIAWLKDDEITELTFSPAEAGLTEVPLSALIGGDPQFNAELVRKVLAGAAGPQRDVVLLNSAALFVCAGQVDDFRQGVELAATSIDDGRALRKLVELIEFSNSE
jgi:anthranilate phosphoribosyltransferase